MISLNLMKNNPQEVSFYKLTALPIIKAAPKLIEKIFFSSQRLVVVAPTEEMVKSLDDGLWVYSSKYFIPHATFQDNFSEEQPIFITNKLENPNQAVIAMAIGKVDLDPLPVEKYLYMFDGNQPEEVEFSRSKYKEYKSANINLVYWQQKTDGTWENL